MVRYARLKILDMRFYILKQKETVDPKKQKDTLPKLLVVAKVDLNNSSPSD